MRKNRVKEICASGGVAVTAWCGSVSPYLAEVAGHSGADCVTVDMQHGLMGIETAISCLQAISSTPAMPMLRVPANYGPVIMHALDAGAYGIICPMVSTPDDARAFVEACMYPPFGNRSFGPQRGFLYGGADYALHANEETLKLAMIETREGLENLDAILETEHLDGVYIGPNDFSLALGGKPACEPDEPQVVEAIERVVKAARAKGMICGIFSLNGEAARMRAEQGFNFLTPGGDVGQYRNGLTQSVSAARGEDKKNTGGGY